MQKFHITKELRAKVDEYCKKFYAELENKEGVKFPETYKEKCDFLNRCFYFAI